MERAKLGLALVAAAVLLLAAYAAGRTVQIFAVERQAQTDAQIEAAL